LVLRLGVVVYNWDAKGGMERQAAQVAARLARRGNRVVVVSTVAPRDLGRFDDAPPGVTVHRIPVTRTPVFETAARALFARAGGVDVVYGVHYRCGVHAARIAAPSATPVAVKFAGGGAHGDFAHFAGRPDRARARALLGTCDRFVCVSEQIRAEAIADGFPAERCLLLPNGVDLERFQDDVTPAALPWDAAQPTILYVGRLGGEKNLDVLLRAFARVRARVPAARLALAGAGERDAELRLLARELALGEAVAFLGPRGDVEALHRAARAFVLPSTSEGLPNALLEALAAGTPAVATDIEGVRAVARHEREALLVPVRDEEALGASLARVLEDEALARRLAEAGRARARDYDLDEVARRYEELFSELARGRPARRWRVGPGGWAVLGARALARMIRSR
jgi:glycosyltransferase involved in cell wall biosynthesis